MKYSIHVYLLSTFAIVKNKTSRNWKVRKPALLHQSNNINDKYHTDFSEFEIRPCGPWVWHMWFTVCTQCWMLRYTSYLLLRGTEKEANPAIFIHIFARGADLLTARLLPCTSRIWTLSKPTKPVLYCDSGCDFLKKYFCSWWWFNFGAEEKTSVRSMHQLWQAFNVRYQFKVWNLVPIFSRPFKL